MKKSSPANVSKILNKYVDIYKQNFNNQDEVKYQLTPADVVALGPDYISPDKSRAYFCFYNMPAEKYDKEYNNFAEAAFYQTNRLNKDGKIKMHLNVVIPVRDGVVDTVLMNEMISHELMHAYRNYSEISQGHFNLSNFYFNLFKKTKYSMYKRKNAYEKTMPFGSGSDSDKFRWVGYVLNDDEMYANLAGIDGFIHEHHGKKYDLKQSRFVELTDTIREYLDWIKTNADDDLWKFVIKNVSYLPLLKDEPLSHFKNRWIKYYENQLKKFDAKLQKIIERDAYKTQQFKDGKKKIIKKHTEKIMSFQKHKEM